LSLHDVVRGIGVSPGVAYARATLVRTNFPEVPDRTVHPDQVEAEVTRLREAVALVTEQLSELGQKVLLRAGDGVVSADEALVIERSPPHVQARCGPSSLLRCNSLIACQTASCPYRLAPARRRFLIRQENNRPKA